eukprot:TRINITY_DN5596_c0_g1_i1.p1 TRINITY_DN5596_c0_g1~~TRINITY_DN5596_c0_g1_i1.p1  ORF type:complete len:447 (+),score=25.11 TRINITY_DN5596_c0_g1_i1:114-1454(+)
MDDGDWLYQVKTRRCHYGGWDNTPTSLGSAIFFLCWFLLSVAAVACAHRRASTAVDVELVEDVKKTSPSKRLCYLDYMRVVAVACVVTEHSGGDIYSDRNVGFVLHWVLPYLYMTSGICYMLSKSPLWRYELRLFVVFVVGVGANRIADMINGIAFDGRFGETMFQMAYVFILMLLGVISAPLRLGFKGKWSGTESIKVGYVNAALAAFYLLCTLYALVCMFQGLKVLPVFDQPFWVGFAAAFKDNSTVLVVTLCGTLFLCSLSAYLGHNDLLGWILLGYVYVPRVVAPFGWVGFSHLTQLYFVGMAVERGHLRGQQALREFIRAHWPLGVAACLLLSMPAMSGRCDSLPPDTYWERFRFYSVELAFTLALLSGALESADPYGALGWLCKWALYAYCFHEAWQRLCPRPWGAVISYSSAILFYAGHRLSKAKVLSKWRDGVKAYFG